MNTELRAEPLDFDLYGLSAKVLDHDYAGTGTRLMGEVAEKMKEAGLSYRGVECWVYETSTDVFIGSHHDDSPRVSGFLEHKVLRLTKYLYYRHVGPSDSLGDVHRGLENEISERGLTETGPRIEKYGKWDPDPSQLVTEVYIGLA
ncbi:MAG TPA: GyrI-like domain-containing protein [Pyrinomonadaceae bacterium]|jgi:effector-binding domain-containing protein